jgi:iron(III) transport system substrate-binding protein
MRFATTLGVTAVTVALTGCGAAASSSSGSRSDATITLYNGQHQPTTQLLVTKFEKETGVTVNIRSASGAGLENQIEQEGSSSPADVVFTENSPPLVSLSEKGLLAGAGSAALSNVPSKYSSPRRDWVGVAARETVFVYNPRLLGKDELPRSILDLAKPKWKGKVGIAPAEGDFRPLVTAVDVIDGKPTARDWLDGLASNAKTYNSNGAILHAVNDGSLTAGVINNYYWFRRRQDIGSGAMHAKLYYFGHHDPGALVNISGAGVLKSSDHKKAARRFLAFLTGRAAQRAIANSDDFEYPLNPHVEANPALKPFGQLDPPNISVEQLGDGQHAIKQLRGAGLL